MCVGHAKAFLFDLFGAYLLDLSQEFEVVAVSQVDAQAHFLIQRLDACESSPEVLPDVFFDLVFFGLGEGVKIHFREIDTSAIFMVGAQVAEEVHFLEGFPQFFCCRQQLPVLFVAFRIDTRKHISPTTSAEPYM